MFIIATAAKTVGVRHDYSNEAVWRDALGNAEPLFPFAIYGDSLDAPEGVPGGAVKSYGRHGVGQCVANREAF